MSTMNLPELVKRLQPYPSLLAKLLESLTVDEFNELVDATLNSDEVYRNGYLPYNSPDSEDESRDVSAAAQTLTNLVDCNAAEPSLLHGWIRLIIDERFAGQDGDDRVNRRVQVCQGAPPVLRSILDSVEIETLPTLGPAVAGAMYSGPTRTRVVLGDDAFYDELEAEFLVYRLLCHRFADASGVPDVYTDPQPGFGCWVEYRADLADETLAEFVDDLRDYRKHEALINDAALTLMYDSYGCEPGRGNLVRELLRAEIFSAVIVRKAVEHRHRLRASVRGLLRHLSLAVAGKPILSTIRGRLRYPPQIAVVRTHAWSPVYLIWADDDGQRWRRRIPSRRIVYALGLRLDYAQQIDPKRLGTYRYCGLLLDPDEVSYVGDVLAEACALALPGRTLRSLLGQGGSQPCLEVQVLLSRERQRHYLELTAR